LLFRNPENMYKNFFGLTRSPFDISPDPYFLFQTPWHIEALAAIAYGVSQRKGFMVLTGEVGTGKTLVVQCLMEMLHKREVATANIFNPRLKPVEFLHFVVGDLGMTPVSPDNKGALLLQLYNFLIRRQREKRPTALIVDEAQNMDYELLEEIRLLTNLETAQQKLLQIVLVGQPELDHKLDSTELRQLKQRITLRCHLKSFQEKDTKAYVLGRLNRAGANARSSTIFSPSAIAALHSHSQGIPRLINTICENALIAAYAEQSPTISEAMVDEAAKDLRLQVSSGHNVTAPGFTEGQRVLAKSMLELVGVLEKVARGHYPAPAEYSGAKTASATRSDSWP
jgi:general secretion pathway protein A